MTSSFRYRAYGCDIFSALPIAGLEEGDFTKPDITISLAEIGRPIPAPGTDGYYEFGADETYMAWHEVGGFLLRNGNTIDIEPLPGVTPEFISLPLLGPVIALLLHMRGLHVLHGSAVSIGGRAVAFLGEKGAGKSTTAATMTAAGYPLITDDVLAIDDADESRIAPGLPQLKLMQDAFDFISIETAVAQAPIDGFMKRQQRVARGFSHAPIEPCRLYVIRRGAAAEICGMSYAEAMAALMRNSFLSLFARRQRQPSAVELAHMMRACANLASRAQVKYLTAPASLDRLDEVVSCVERDVQSASGALAAPHFHADSAAN